MRVCVPHVAFDKAGALVLLLSLHVLLSSLAVVGDLQALNQPSALAGSHVGRFSGVAWQRFLCLVDLRRIQ